RLPLSRICAKAWPTCKTAAVHGKRPQSALSWLMTSCTRWCGIGQRQMASGQLPMTRRMLTRGYRSASCVEAIQPEKRQGLLLRVQGNIGQQFTHGRRELETVAGE